MTPQNEASAASTPQAQDGPPVKKRRLSGDAPKGITAASLAAIPRAKKAATNGNIPSAFREQRREPAPRPRSPSPGERSPPRERKRPRAMRPVADRETLRRQQEEREAREAEARRQMQAESRARGQQDSIFQTYNAVPQWGKKGRQTDSKISGLRSLNNWIKSCVIQKFSPSEEFRNTMEKMHRNEHFRYRRQDPGLLVFDIGCGKGGDMLKWDAAPQRVQLYVGMDGANVSIEQAEDRVAKERKKNKIQFQTKFAVRDCFGTNVADEAGQIVRGSGIQASGFDVVSMMFCMHYAFETEQKAKNMIRNVAYSLKKGGRFIGTIPSSEVINAKLAEYHAKRGVQAPVKEAEEESDDEWDPEKPSEPKATESPSTTPPQASTDMPEDLEFGNSIYSVKIPRAATFPTDGIYRPPYGWRYNYWLEEAVEAPEFVVPWAAFRALASEFGLELHWEKSFGKIWEEEKDDPELGPLSKRMGVVDRETGQSRVSDLEMEASFFYRAFCFYKT